VKFEILSKKRELQCHWYFYFCANF